MFEDVCSTFRSPLAMFYSVYVAVQRLTKYFSSVRRDVRSVGCCDRSTVNEGWHHLENSIEHFSFDYIHWIISTKKISSKGSSRFEWQCQTSFAVLSIVIRVNVEERRCWRWSFSVRASANSPSNCSIRSRSAEIYEELPIETRKSAFNGSLLDWKLFVDLKMKDLMVFALSEPV